MDYEDFMNNRNVRFAIVFALTTFQYGLPNV